MKFKIKREAEKKKKMTDSHKGLDYNPKLSRRQNSRLRKEGKTI